MKDENKKEWIIFDDDEKYNEKSMREWWKEQLEIDNEDLCMEDIAADLGLVVSELSEKELKALECLVPAVKAKKMDKEPDFERWCEEVNEMYDLEKYNLDERLDGQILVIADIGLWDGRRSGLKFLDGNLNNVLTAFCDNCNIKVYCDEENVCSRQADHDGTSHYIFRLVSDEQRERIQGCEDLTQDFLMENSTSLRQYVADIYGW